MFTVKYGPPGKASATTSDGPGATVTSTGKPYPVSSVIASGSRYLIVTVSPVMFTVDAPATEALTTSATARAAKAIHVFTFLTTSWISG